MYQPMDYFRGPVDIYLTWGKCGRTATDGLVGVKICQSAMFRFSRFVGDLLGPSFEPLISASSDHDAPNAGHDSDLDT